MRRAKVIAAVVAGLSAVGVGCGGGNSSPVASEPGMATVERVVDGDTIRVRVEGRDEPVRLVGIDTPESVKPGEPVECYAKQASKFNERLVTGRRVRLRVGRERTDRYGRLLAYVYAGDEFVNAALVRGGYARTLTIPPNIAHAGLFHRLARAAGRAGRGLWRAC